MTWQQLAGWQRYHQLEPFGEERADLRMGILASLYANAHRGKSSDKVLTASDFMPKFDSGDGKSALPGNGGRRPMGDAEWARSKKAAAALASDAKRQRRGRRVSP
jgi:hypothetical protein